jgi:hypothetical protein
MSEWPKVYAWTPGKPAYKFYPQYANFKLWEDGRCVVTVRAGEFRTVGQEHYEMGETVCIQLPPDAAAELGAFFASAGEAGTAATVQQGAVHEHATAEGGDAQPSGPLNHPIKE